MADHPQLFSAPMICALMERRKTKTRRLLTPRNCTVLGYGVTAKSLLWTGLNFDLAQQRGSYLAVPWLHKDDLSRGMEWEEAGDYRVRARVEAGDRLWVREAHYLTDNGHAEYAVYAADAEAVAAHFEAIKALSPDFPAEVKSRHLKLRPGIHMPRWASRLTLQVDQVRVERLNDITEDDALAEGVIWSERLEGFVVPGIGHPNKDFPVLSRPTAREMYAALWDVINGPGAWLGNPWVLAYTFRVVMANIDSTEELAA